MLYIISAASGTGKTSLAAAVAQQLVGVKISVSHTTRSPRIDERSNKHYHYVSTEQFEKLIREDKFLEYAKVFGNYYGTAKDFVWEQLLNGNDVILDIDWQGARQVKRQIETRSIFLLPPSLEELRHRLEKRRDDSSTVETRLQTAGTEIAHYQEFDYIVLNDNFDRAVADLLAIFRANRLLLPRQQVLQQKLLADLLSS